MSGKYPFPDDIRDPSRQGPNPFSDGDADGGDTEQPGAERGNYAPGELASEYRPEYQRVLTDRTGRALVAGVLGLLVSILGLLSYLIPVFAPVRIMALFAIAGSLSAIVTSMLDLRAMKEGAMVDDRRGRARMACLIGVLGLICSLGVLGFWLGRWVYFLLV